MVSNKEYACLIGQYIITFSAMEFFISQTVYGMKLTYEQTNKKKGDPDRVALYYDDDLDFFQQSNTEKKFDKLVSRIKAAITDEHLKEELDTWLFQFHAYRQFRNTVVHSLAWVRKEEGLGEVIRFFKGGSVKYKPYGAKIEDIEMKLNFLRSFMDHSLKLFGKIRSTLNPTVYG